MSVDAPPALAVEAFLLLAFREAAEDTAGWLLPPQDPRHPWRRLYWAAQGAVEGGLEVLAERQVLLDRVEKLQAEVDRLNGLVPRPATLPVVEGEANPA